MLRGRVLVAHNARFDLGVLRGAFARAALDWPDPPVFCTVAMARRLAPLQRRRGLAALADALGIEVGVTHRALPDAETCARVFCALFGRLTRARGHDRRGRRAAARRPPQRGRPAAARRRAAAPAVRAAGLLRAAARPGRLRVPRRRRASALRRASRSACARARARTSRRRRSGRAQAEHVDYQATRSELGALLLEDRLIKALRPPGNTRGKRSADGYVYLRCRLDIPFPILEVALRAGARARRCASGRCAGAAAAAELVEQLNSLFGLRHCGRKLPRRAHPSAYGQMGRCLSPCLGDLDPNLYRERLDRRCGCSSTRATAAAPCWPTSTARSARPPTSATTSARRGCGAGASGSSRSCGGSAACCAPPTRARGSCSRAIPSARPFDAFWLAGGRVVDWGALPDDADELEARTAAALRAVPRPELGGWLPAEELAEIRLVGAWMAAHEPPWLELDAGVLEAGRLARWIRSVESTA